MESALPSEFNFYDMFLFCIVYKTETWKVSFLLLCLHTCWLACHTKNYPRSSFQFFQDFNKNKINCLFFPTYSGIHLGRFFFYHTKSADLSLWRCPALLWFALLGTFESRPLFVIISISDDIFFCYVVIPLPLVRPIRLRVCRYYHPFMHFNSQF